MFRHASWIWTADELAGRNSFVRFRRGFSYTSGPASIHITADSRYVLYVNGEYIGQGPVRAWPAHWRYDTYDIEPYLRVGENTIAVLVNHYGESNFQYISQPPGLLAQVELPGETIVTDDSWLASADKAFASITPRISIQESFEEQFDARLDDGWIHPEYQCSWSQAVELRPANDGLHENMAPRGIPFLTLEPVSPQRVLSVEAVSSTSRCYTIRYKPYVASGDLSCNQFFCHAYVATRIWSPVKQRIELSTSGSYTGRPGAVKMNGELIVGGTARLDQGWNNLVASVRGSNQWTEITLTLNSHHELVLSSTGHENGSPWAVVGPFGLSAEERRESDRNMDESLLMVEPPDSRATLEAGEVFWDSCDMASAAKEPYFQQVLPDDLSPVNVFLQAYNDMPVDAQVRVDLIDAIVSGNEWATVYPTPDGEDVRILLDFGKEVVGYQRFEVSAAEGTIIDFHNFEFIQPDGRHNLAEGMNNTFRYICREGRQEYRTLLRRGFRYSYLMLRNLRSPVRLRRIETLFATYPQTMRGEFVCSDAKLNRIWQVGAHTLRCCSEDTYTDCPTYEQAHWVGDARNEALVDWMVNGDPRLWFRCLEQTGDSLDRSRITESNVPSGWRNILPAWSFLWMRSCHEYMLYSGNVENSRRLLSYVERNIEGILGCLNAEGLFDIRAWNMFDWAEMDTPAQGVVTHQNCLAVRALRDVSEMAGWLGEVEQAERWSDIAHSLSEAINSYLWNDEKQAYTDCLRDGVHSPIYSQQTQTAAYVSGVATGDRARRCSEIVHNPPEGFVRAGSPFFEFFLLEAYHREGKVQEFLNTIRRDWGFMVDMGATTFWEMWSGAGSDGRLTRSHCHGWSAAPTFFLNMYVLGVRPGGPGFAPVVIEPHPGDLSWCRGIVPTPAGDVEVYWEDRTGKPFAMQVKAPDELDVRVRLPREGTLLINGHVAEACEVLQTSRGGVEPNWA